MGKAGKWIRNLLMGKRDQDKGKKISGPLLETSSSSRPFPRRWSFKRSTSKVAITTHKTTTSHLDEYPINYAMLLALNAHAAATKIQAVYRSYLARRALRALKGLVKLQALTRGHLVRKQMNGVLRSMHTAIAIQVRARIHRIQMAQIKSLIDTDKFFTVSHVTYSFIHHIYESMSPASYHISLMQNNTNSFPRSGSLRSRSVRPENDTRTRSSGRPSVEYQLKMSPSPSKYEWSSESSSKMARREYSGRYNACPEATKHHRFMFSPSNSQFVPNYMSNTKSSEAKAARSHSEPRQRPKSKGRRSSSMDAKIYDDDTENQQYPWLAASSFNL